MKIVTINLPENDLEMIEYFIAQGRFPSRSELVRYAVREFIRNELKVEKEERKFMAKKKVKKNTEKKDQDLELTRLKTEIIDIEEGNSIDDFFSPKLHYYKETASPIFRKLNQSFRAPNKAIKMAWKIYSDIIKQNIAPKRPIEHLVSASYYIATRIIEFTVLIEDIAELIEIRKMSLMSTISLITIKILMPINLKINPITEKELIFKFCNDLRLPKSIAEKTIKLLDTVRVIDKDLGRRGNKSFIAAAIYISCRNSKNRRSQAKIANLARVSTVTLRDRINKIKSVKGYDEWSKKIFARDLKMSIIDSQKLVESILQEGKPIEQKVDVNNQETLNTLLAKLDNLITKGVYQSRMDALRAVLKEFLEDKKKDLDVED